MILVVNVDTYIEDQIIDVIDSNCHNWKVRARNVNNNNVNLAVEVKTRQPKVLVEELYRINEVTSVSLIEHDGDVTA